MTKTLNIKIYQDPTKHLEIFLHDWQLIGTFEDISDMEYKLTSHDEKVSTLSISQDQITISGNIPSKSFMLIDTLSKACESDKVLEGDVIDKNQTRPNNHQSQQPNFEDLFSNQSGGAGFKMPMGMGSMLKISKMSKFKVILLLILALPLLIIMIPVAIIFSIVKVIMFKLRFK